MIKEIVKDTEFLTQKSEQVSLEEAQEIITDLLDTANHHIDNCAGLAAPQINKSIRLFVIDADPFHETYPEANNRPPHSATYMYCQ